MAAEPDERLALFATPRDWLRYAIGRFRAAGLAFGHGATTALDEAAYLILEGLNLPIDSLDPFLDARLLRSERERLDALIEARVTTRKPAAYLLNRAYIQGVPFYVDERVIVPRSFIGELLMTAFAEENALTGDPGRISRALDLCTGGGSLAILAARVFPNARIDAVDLSPDALEVARRNVDEHRARRSRNPHRRRSLRAAQRRAAMISFSSIRPMSTPKPWPPFRPNTPPSRGWRMRAGRTGSTSCGGSCARRPSI